MVSNANSSRTYATPEFAVLDPAGVCLTFYEPANLDSIPN